MPVIRCLSRNVLKLWNIRTLSTSSRFSRRAHIAKEDIEVIQTRERRILNDSKQVDPSAGRAQFEIPGFPLSDFTRTGKLGVWNLLKTFEVVRRLFGTDSEKAFDSLSDENIAPVVTSQKLEINPELYENAALVRPMHVLLRPGHAGKTAISIIIELKDAKTGVLYASNQRQIVSLDLKSGKSVPLPKSFPNFKELADPAAEPVIVPEWIPSSNAQTHTFNIQHTDTDHLYHTNQATYLRYCINAAANACNDGKLKNFSSDFFRYDVSSALIRYLGESFPGDDLGVTLWEDQGDFDSLYFHISRSNKLIMTAKLTYFKSATSKL